MKIGAGKMSSTQRFLGERNQQKQFSRQVLGALHARRESCGVTRSEKGEAETKTGSNETPRANLAGEARERSRKPGASPCANLGPARIEDQLGNQRYRGADQRKNDLAAQPGARTEGNQI
jgi:hypothetical protein